MPFAFDDAIKLIGMLGGAAIASTGGDDQTKLEQIYSPEQVRQFSDQIFGEIMKALEASKQPVEIISPPTPGQQPSVQARSAATGKPITLGGWGPGSPGYVPPFESGTNYMYSPPGYEEPDATTAIRGGDKQSGDRRVPREARGAERAYGRAGNQEGLVPGGGAIPSMGDDDQGMEPSWNWGAIGGAAYDAVSPFPRPWGEDKPEGGTAQPFAPFDLGTGQASQGITQTDVDPMVSATQRLIASIMNNGSY